MKDVGQGMRGKVSRGGGKFKEDKAGEASKDIGNGNCSRVKRKQSMGWDGGGGRELGSAKRRETRDKRQETKDGRRKTGDGRQETRNENVT